ncbi:MAG: FAD-dependent oxidoreductase [Solirubrobacterales bacterium]
MSEPNESGAEVRIVGGGVAGIEALLALHDLAGDRARLTLIAPEPDFVYKPLLVEEPFGLGPPEQYALQPLAEEASAEFLPRAASAVDPGAHRLELDDGSSLDYDYLVVCVGGRLVPAFGRAITFPNPTEPLRIDPVLDRAASGGGRIAFVVPPTITWSLPLYELALMTERRARERGDEVALTLVTPETTPLAVFGAAASSAVGELLSARGIEVVCGERAHEEEGSLVLTPGDREVEADVVIALPAMEGPAIEGLPADDDGFIPVDHHSRVRGADDVYGAGDGTNFPLKQGGLATQQADAAAEDIAHHLGAALEPQPFRPVLRGQLLTGDASLHLRTEIAGGGGEGIASLDRLWWPPHKISGRYLAPMLYHGELHEQGRPPGETLDVELALPQEWHIEPMTLDPHAPPNVD